MITVYHGSVITVKQPIAKAGREKSGLLNKLIHNKYA